MDIQLLRSCTLLVRIPRVPPTVIHIYPLSGKFHRWIELKTRKNEMHLKIKCAHRFNIFLVILRTAVYLQTKKNEIFAVNLLIDQQKCK